MMASPHTLVEGVIISSYAIRANKAFIYVRGEVLHVVRRLQRAVAGGLPGRPPRQGHPRLGLRPRPGRARRCRRLHLRRGDRAARLPRGPPRPTAPAAAVPRGGRSLRQPDGDQQRRVDRVGAEHHRPTAPTGSPRWAPRSPRASASSRLSGHVTKPGPVRSAAGHHPARADRPRRRHARGPRAEVLDARRLEHPAADRRAPRRAARLRGRRRGRLDARHPRAADLRRDHLRGPGRAAVDRVLQARVLRQVHPVPRGHLVAGADAGPAREGPGHRGRPRPPARPVRQHPRPLVLRPR